MLVMTILQEDVYIYSDACLLISFGTKQFIGFEYTLVPFLSINILGLLLICFFYAGIMWHAFKIGRDVQGMSGQRVRKKCKTYVKLALLILTNVVYWIPLDVLFFPFVRSTCLLKCPTGLLYLCCQ